MTNIDQHLSNWGEQKQQRLRLGDVLDEPRDLDHFFVFRRRSAVAAATKSLEAAGFRVTVMPGLLRTTVQATRANSLGEDEVTRALREVVGIANAHGGKYDGFGGEIVLGPEERQRRANLSRRSRELRRMLVEWDPIGVYQDDPRPEGDDEYDDLIWPIIGWLDEGVTPEELSAHIVGVLRNHYGLSPKDDSAEIGFSRQLLTWWETAH